MPIDPQLLGGGSRFDGRTFDLVLSSEVVEHVPDPVAFVETLAAHVADDGLLLLTTPSTGFIRPSRNVLDCLGTFWPGIHHAVFTRDRLAELLGGLGFAGRGL